MDFSGRTEAPYIIAGLIGVVTFSLSMVLAAFMDPHWTFQNNCLSEFGISDSPGVAGFFRVSCYVSGALIALFGLGKVLFENPLNKVAGAFLIGAGASLFGVGTFTMHTIELHNLSAGLFAATTAAGIALATISDIIEGERMMLIAGMVIGAVCLFTVFLEPQNTSEFVTVFCAAVWAMFEMVKYARRGMFSSAAEEGTSSA